MPKRNVEQMTLTEAESLLTKLKRNASKFGADEKRAADLKRVARHIERLKKASGT